MAERSAGFVGTSDGWQDVSQHKQMEWSYERAEHGNVALTGEVDLAASGGQFLLALGFGRDEGEAGHRARASLLQGFEAARKEYVRRGPTGKRPAAAGGSKQHPQNLYHISAAVMRTHEGKPFQGGIIASLATPWGSSKGDGDLGYHLVWPRDMIETVGGLLAIQKHEDARRVLSYFHVTQDADGHWPQNMFTNGLHSGTASSWTRPRSSSCSWIWPGGKRPEGRAPAIRFGRWSARRPAIWSATAPVTPLDRWEEEAGYFASTMAVEIAALLAAADLAEHHGEPAMGTYLRETADAWNDVIERLIYVTGTDLARQAGVDGYYVRFRPAGPDGGGHAGRRQRHSQEPSPGKGHHPDR